MVRFLTVTFGDLVTIPPMIRVCCFTREARGIRGTCSTNTISVSRPMAILLVHQIILLNNQPIPRQHTMHRMLLSQSPLPYPCQISMMILSPYTSSMPRMILLSEPSLMSKAVQVPRSPGQVFQRIPPISGMSGSMIVKRTTSPIRGRSPQDNQQKTIRPISRFPLFPPLMKPM